MLLLDLQNFKSISSYLIAVLQLAIMFVSCLGPKPDTIAYGMKNMV